MPERTQAIVELKYGDDLSCPILKFIARSRAKSAAKAEGKQLKLTCFEKWVVRLLCPGAKRKARIAETKKLSAEITMELRAGAHCIQGASWHMEDRALVCKLTESCVYAAVFDGHAGKGAAEYAATHMHNTLALSPEFISGDVVSALGKAVAHTNKGFLAEADDGSGTTACVLVRTRERLVWGNCGDSRLVLYTGGGAEQLSRDHKATDHIERKRIEHIGGKIEDGRVVATDGVCMLACARAIGDGRFKDIPLVTSDADIKSRHVDTRDEFALIASDGVWDVLTNDEACELVKGCLGEAEDVAQRAAAKVCDAALKAGSRDNISAAVVLL